MSRVLTTCPKCHDSGTVTIWHPETLTSLKRGDNPVKLKEAVAACNCCKGTAHTSRLENGQNVAHLERLGARQWHCQRTIRERKLFGSIFNPAADVEDFGTPALKSFVANKPPNYVDAFDDWNNR